MKFVNWAEHRFQGMGDTSATPGNGDRFTFTAYATDRLKTYLGYPTEIKVTAPATDFSLTSITFDQTDKTFDVT